jgi:hypothetical protein
MSEKLFEKINTQLKQKPLVYFCREVERAIGFEHIIENYHICCIEDNHIVDELIKRGYLIFCLEREVKDITYKSTVKLPSHPKVLNWLDKIKKDGEFYSMSFFPSDVLDFKLKKLGATTLGNPYKFYLEFENKLRASQFFKNNNIRIPENFINILGEDKYSDLKTKLGVKFIVQLEKSHTGAGTFIINDENQFQEIINQYKGNTVKFSKFIDGETYTLNVCITEEHFHIGPLQYQITGIEELTTGKGSTVGNDFTKGIEVLKDNLELKKDLTNQINLIAAALTVEGYRGLLGVDLIISDNKAYVLEINARQTANIPLQTKLEFFYDIPIPLQIINLATFLNIKTENNLYSNLNEVKGSQIFLRALSNNTKINVEPKSGVYRLQSDNAALDNILTGEKKDNTILIDEDGDKPLIYKSPGYNVLDLEQNSGFILNFQRDGQVKNEFEELARMQFTESLMQNGQIKPWIMESLKSLREKITK